MKKLDKEQVIKGAKTKAKSFVEEFKAFAIKGNAVELAIGMVIGTAFTSIVNSIVKDIITPLIGAITGGFNYEKLFISLNGIRYPSIEAATEAGAPVLTYGNFITAVINFLIVSLVIFIVFKKLFAFHKKDEEVPAAPTEKECPYCKSTINIAATKCPHCTSNLE